MISIFENINYFSLIRVIIKRFRFRSSRCDGPFLLPKMKKIAKNPAKLGVLLDKHKGCCSSVHQSRIKAFGWKSYENKHYENIFTRFYEGYWLPKKFGYDKRKCYFSSEILSGQMDRNEALKLLEQNPYDEKTALEDMDYIVKRLGFNKDDFLSLMNSENKTFRNYRNSEKLLKLAIKFAMLVGVEKRNFR